MFCMPTDVQTKGRASNTGTTLIHIAMIHVSIDGATHVKTDPE